MKPIPSPLSRDSNTSDITGHYISRVSEVVNFRSMFVNIPDGKPDGIKLISVGDVATKDAFATIKGITSQDVLTAHRNPPLLSNIIPSNGGGLGDPEKYDATYARNEVLPLCELVRDPINTASLPRSLWVDFRETVGTAV